MKLSIQALIIVYIQIKTNVNHSTFIYDFFSEQAYFSGIFLNLMSIAAVHRVSAGKITEKKKIHEKLPFP